MGVQSKNSEKWEKISIMENNTQMRFITYLDRNTHMLHAFRFVQFFFQRKTANYGFFQIQKRVDYAMLPYHIPFQMKL